MKALTILLIGLFLISFTSAFTPNKLTSATLDIISKDTNDEKVILNYLEGEIQCELNRFYPNLNTWARVKGTFINSSNGKFGAIDSLLLNGKTAQYRYTCYSRNPTYEKEGYYFFYNGDEKDLDGFIHIDFTDVCNRDFNGVNAGCSYNMYKKERWFFPDTYYLEVTFTSDRNIDPNFAGGAGTSISPYQITNWSALNDVRGYLSSYFILMNDLNSSTSDYAGIGDSWLPIGNSTSTSTYFTGNFNGNGYTIADYKVSGITTGYLGLFGYVQTGTGRYVQNFNVRNATVFGTGTGNYIAGVVAYMGTTGRVRGINVSDSNITGYQYVGGISAYMSSGSLLDNCMYNGSVRATYRLVGGVVGYETSSNSVATKITNVKSYGSAYSPSGAGYSYIGGLVGLLTGTLQNGYTEMNVTGLGDYVGGAVGQISNYNQIINITANNKVSCTLNYCGGIIGGGTVAPNTATNVKFDKLYFYGNLSSAGLYTGGIIGGLIFTNYNYPAQINNSYFGGFINATGTTKLYVGGLIGYASSSNASHNFAQNSVSNGTIISKSNYTGGLIGRTYLGGGLNSYSLSNITCTHFCSSGIGYIIGDGNFSNIYSAGFINASGINATGLVSLINTSANINLFNSYWDINATGQTTSELGTGYTTSQMKDINNFANWTISGTLTDLNNGYPYLAWQGGVSGIWLIYNGTAPTTCWTRVGNSLLIKIPCAIPIGAI